MRHSSQFYPTHSRLVYDLTGTILAILYREMPHMLPAKYQPNPPGGSGVMVEHDGSFKCKVSFTSQPQPQDLKVIHAEDY